MSTQVVSETKLEAECLGDDEGTKTTEVHAGHYQAEQLAAESRVSTDVDVDRRKEVSTTVKPRRSSPITVHAPRGCSGMRPIRIAADLRQTDPPMPWWVSGIAAVALLSVLWTFAVMLWSPR